MDPATRKFEQALPLVLQPAHPRLAALHAARTHAANPAICARCGAVLAVRTRVVRAKHNTRVIAASCTVCGAASSTPVERGNAAAFPPYRRRSGSGHAAPPRQPPVAAAPPPSTRPIPLPVSSQAHVPEDRSSSRPSSKKKKSALQEMLQRNRDNEKKRTDSANAAGLSAFLSTL
ncbi:hypothetical protein HYPSUDRAFT_270249 [Hypholoma sublateritium FD-334 SS-4]|uniref:Uncharacterized protein n=1 Tax=Hypholoma sublateritium (strain FD-334 SS-4) TaxID=945553 RepID=A0A0D2QFA9_HYPSF|nr:hypothetical protein HYPSUDRAFT_270249 [Hypholoma sublateritium FD-334 SS-4]